MEPKIGLYSASVGRASDGDVLKSIDIIAELGFKGAQLGTIAGHPSFESLPEGKRRCAVVEYARERGVEVVSASSKISHETTGPVEERIKPLRETVDQCADCGVPIIIVHGGGSAGENEEENQAAWSRLVEELKCGCEYAAEKGIKVAMEPAGWTGFAHGWRTLNRLHREIGDTFYVNLDPANILMVKEDPVRAVEVLGKQIVHAHVKDAAFRFEAPAVDDYVATLNDTASNIHWAEWRKALYTGYRPEVPKPNQMFMMQTPVGEGLVDFKGLLRALDAAGFDGWFMIERESKQEWEVQRREIIKARDHILNMAKELD